MPGAGIVIGLLISWSFVGTGLYAWWRRPASRFGALMTAVGFTYMLGALTASDDSVVFTIGVLAREPLLRRLRPHAARLSRRAARAPLARVAARRRLRPGAGRAAAAAAVGLHRADDRQLPGLPGVGAADRAQRHAARRLQRRSSSVIGVALVAVVLVILIRRWRAATPPQRRAMAPVLWSGVAMLVAAGQRRWAATPPASRASPTCSAGAGLLVFASVPWVFLIGLVRSRVARAGAVSELLLRLGEAPGTGTLRCRLADALGDRSLQLVFWLEDKGRWVDSDGPRGRAARRRRPGARVDRGRARGPPRRRDRARPDAVRGARAAAARWRPPPAWRWRTSACRRSCAPASRSCAPRARGSSRPARTSAGGSSATCTTAPSSGWSRSR